MSCEPPDGEKWGETSGSPTRGGDRIRPTGRVDGGSTTASHAITSSPSPSSIFRLPARSSGPAQRPRLGPRGGSRGTRSITVPVGSAWSGRTSCSSGSPRRKRGEVLEEDVGAAAVAGQPAGGRVGRDDDPRVVPERVLGRERFDCEGVEDRDLRDDRGRVPRAAPLRRRATRGRRSRARTPARIASRNVASTRPTVSGVDGVESSTTSAPRQGVQQLVGRQQLGDRFVARGRPADADDVRTERSGADRDRRTDGAEADDQPRRPVHLAELVRPPRMRACAAAHSSGRWKWSRTARSTYSAIGIELTRARRRPAPRVRAAGRRGRGSRRPASAAAAASTPNRAARSTLRRRRAARTCPR